MLFKSLSLGNPVIQRPKLTQMGLIFFSPKALFSFMFLSLYIVRLRYSLFPKHTWKFFFFFFCFLNVWSSFYLRKPTTSISMCMVFTFLEAQIPRISFRFSLFTALKQAPSPLTTSTSLAPLQLGFQSSLGPAQAASVGSLTAGPPRSATQKGLTSNCWINVRKHVPPF